MIFEVTILGCGSATPTYLRNPSSQVLNADGQYFLIDCGEATQIQMNRFKIKPHKIDHIFISHLHGDHYLGLMGLLSSLHLQGRKREMHIYAPKELREIIEMNLAVSMTELRFPLVFHPHSFKTGTVIYRDEHISVEEICLDHRIPCSGFIFREAKRARKLIKKVIERYQIPPGKMNEIKNGSDFIAHDGTVIPNAELTCDSAAPRSYAYCSDTKYNTEVIKAIKGVNVVYHEATFLHDMLARAEETFHSTSLQAAEVAKASGAGQLIIGHFSARYTDMSIMLAESKSVFSNTLLAEEGRTYKIS